MSLTTYTTYETAVAIASVANLLPLWQLLPTPVFGLRHQRMGITRLDVTLSTATASVFALTVPNNLATPTTPIAAGIPTQVELANGGAGPAFGLVASTWAVAPTFAAGANQYRVMPLPAVVGAYQAWTWPEDAPFEPPGFLERDTGSFGGGVVLQNITGVACANVIVGVRWKEFY